MTVKQDLEEKLLKKCARAHGVSVTSIELLPFSDRKGLRACNGSDTVAMCFKYNDMQGGCNSVFYKCPHTDYIFTLSIFKDFGGLVYNFCSEECMRKFL